MPSKYVDEDDPRRWTPAMSKRFRKLMRDRLPMPCSKCGQEVTERDTWAVDHVVPRALMTDEADVVDLTNMSVAHKKCNDVAGAKLGAAMRKARKQNGTSGKGGPVFRDTSGNPARRTSLYDPEHLNKGSGVLEMSADGFPMPRYMSEPHPNARGTYGPQAIAWITKRRLADDLIPDDEKAPLPSWSLILGRALEHDKDGNLCWPLVVLTVPRQSTKSSLMAELMMWRIHHSDLFGERQIAVHSANKLQAAIRIQEDLHPWAEENGLKVARRTGQERITHPDHSRWEITSLTAAYGSRPSLAFLDEAFDVPRELVEKAILPAQARRKSPQTWLVSTANSLCSDLMPANMEQARSGSTRVCLIDWGLPYGADPADRDAWRYTNPFPSDVYLELVEANIHAKDWAAQWLNVWPEVATKKSDEYAMPGWESLAAAPPDPGSGGIVAIDESRDGSVFGRLLLVNGAVYYEEFRRLEDAMPRANRAQDVIIGLTLVEPSIKAGLRVRPIRYGAKETRAFTPLLQNTVRDGKLTHDHSPEMMLQAAGAVVMETESGKAISARRSEHSILSGKLLAWALGFQRGNAQVRPMIF